jgi:hypothetical protein
MASFVVDASVTLSWCFEDEANAGADALLERLRGGEMGILSPYLSQARKKRSFRHTGIVSPNYHLRKRPVFPFWCLQLQ